MKHKYITIITTKQLNLKALKYLRQLNHRCTLNRNAKRNTKNIGAANIFGNIGTH
jgi:hypothetical protein